MFRKIIAAFVLALASLACAQQPQANDIPPTQPIFLTNAKLTNGVAPGYWPTTPAATGLTLNLTAGTANCKGTVVTATATSFTMTNNTTNYVYLDGTSSCVPAHSTSSFTTSQIPIAIVTTSGGNITVIQDVRTMLYLASAGASSSCGAVAGDNTTTNCGDNNQSAGSATSPASVSTFGYNNANPSNATQSTYVGTNNGLNAASTGLQEQVVIGDNNVSGSEDNSFVVVGINQSVDPTANGCFETLMVLIGFGNDTNCTNNNSETSDVVAIGDKNLVNPVSAVDNTMYYIQDVVIGYNNLSFSSAFNPPSLPVDEYDVCIGSNSCRNLWDTNKVIAIGYFALSPDTPTVTTQQIAIGDGALEHYGEGTLGGDHNIAIGTSALQGFDSPAMTGGENIAMGSNSGYPMRTGSYNVMMGYQVGDDPANFGSPTNPGTSLTNGSYDVFIGYEAGQSVAYTTVVNNSIAIGKGALVSESNETVIGNASTVLAIIYGDLEVNAGTNVVYRCATAGTLPAGALTITSGSCGSTTDTGLRVQ